MWEMITKQTEIQDLGINQNSLIYDTSSIRIPSIALLKDRIIRNGIIRIEFIPLNENGVISIIFKHNTLTNENGYSTSFYCFDLVNQGDGSNENQFVLRRIENGLSKELKSITSIKDLENVPQGFSLGYRTNVPHLVQIELIDIKIKISISVNSRPFLFLLEAIDETFKMGQIGFGTYHVKSSFITIELRPPTFIVTGAMAEDYIKNSSEEILMSPYIMSSDESTGDEGDGSLGGGNGDSRNNRSRFENHNDPPWKACVRKTTSDARLTYCNDRFANDYQKKKCKVILFF